MNKKAFITTALAAAILLSGCSANTTEQPETEKGSSQSAASALSVLSEKMDFSYSERDLDGGWDSQNATMIHLNDGASSINGPGAKLEDGLLTISEEGVYVLSGSLTSGRVVVNADKTAKLQVVLNEVSISSPDYAAFTVEQADKVFLTLAEGTKNYLTDADSYTLRSEEDNTDAALFSREDLTINGTGSLDIQGNYNHGMISKDDLVIAGGVLTVTAKGDGLQGKDCVKLGKGTITVTAGADGVKATNSEDSTKGFISLDGASLSIIAETDGLQAETVLRATGGDITLSTGGGSQNASTDQQGNQRPEWGNWGGGFQGQQTPSSSEQPSAKGLKAGGEVLLEGGTFTIDSSDDSIHSNGNVTLSGGSFAICSGDDGIHADSSISISGGEITITKSYEGVEGNAIEISGGTLQITANDDGINGAGGNDASALGGRPGQNQFASGSSWLKISGGTVLVDAAGDGIDVNGNLTITGGTTLINGPTNNGNGAFDYDGTAQISGGYLVAAGSSGMAQGFSSSSSQNSLLYTFASTLPAGQTVSLTDSSGLVLVSYTPSKPYQSVVISGPGIRQNTSYHIMTGGTASAADSYGFASSGSLTGAAQTAEVTLTSAAAVAGASAGTGGGRMPFGR